MYGNLVAGALIRAATMNRTRETPLSICERNFVLEALKDGKRCDGREVYDYRNIQIKIRKEPGHVECQLGTTKVLAVVSSEVVQPRPQRPTEGQLFFNVELSPMASPAFEIGRPSSQATEIGRTLERCFKESRAVDTESLCIIAGEKVWSVRVDLHVLDHCGNIIDCAAVAAITALKHFRRPDVTVIGEEATIHPVTERDPVPLSVHHMPLCITFAFFLEGEYLLVDPTRLEEGVMDGKLVVGMNVHREICALQMTGGVAILPDQVLRCSQIAAVKCAEITEAIKSALSGGKHETKEVSSILSTKKGQEELAVPEVVTMAESASDGERGVDGSAMEVEKPQVTYLGEGTVELGMGGQSTWGVEGEWGSEEEGECRSGEESEEEASTKGVSKSTAACAGGSSSEEEATVLLMESDTGGFEKVQERQDSVPDVSVALKKTKKTKKQSGKQPAAARTKPQQPTKRRKKKL